MPSIDEAVNDPGAFAQMVTEQTEIEAALARLAEHCQHFASLSHQQLADLLDQCCQQLHRVADQWVHASCKAKGIDVDSPRAGEEWLGGPYAILRYMRLLERSHRQIQKHGQPRLPRGVRQLPDGRAAVHVFPGSLTDKLFFMGTRAEVWIKKGVDPNHVEAHTMAAFRDTEHAPRISLVLGAGNVSSIGPMDFLHKLFVARKLAILKMHPVNAYLGPLIMAGFQPLIDANYLAVVYGDAAEGKFLCHHNNVADIHITGSDRTHDAIVFGADVAAMKSAKQPQLAKPITSELGNVSPVIVVPGQWKDKDIERQADNVVSSLVNNAGFNCNATRVIITSREWPQRAAFLDAIRARLKNTATRPAYYPGAAERWEIFQKSHPNAELFGEKVDDHLPWMFLADVNAGNEAELAFRMEAFTGVFAETALPSETAGDFLRAAVTFANQRLWGTLNATLIVDPDTEQHLEEPLSNALRDLAYGTIAVNHWAAIGYAIGSTTWGAFPGHTIYDIVSGMDTVHNAYLLDDAEKSIVYGPFRPWPKPPWFASHRRSHLVGKRLTDFEAAPSLLKMPGIFVAALRG